MKTILLVILSFFSAILTFGQTNLHGAFQFKEAGINHLWLFVDGYSSLIRYQDDKYVSSQGGPFTYTNGLLKIDIEYDDKNSRLIGTTYSTQLKINDEYIKDELGRTWVTKTDNQQKLDGVWRISERKQNGTLSEIPRADRKTIKLLVGGYFQWIAINPAEKGFYGTGGGRYTFKDGKYKEEILFFSRDNSRIGAELVFDGRINDGKWNHSGLSSKGDPIFEIWTREK